MAALYALAFLAAYIAYARAEAGDWTASSWLFLVALPYTLTTLRLVGSVDFSGDAPASVALAALCCCLAAYLAGALIEGALRAALRTLLRRRPRPA